MSYPEDVLSLISGAVADGGKAAREAIAAEARGGDELEQLFWCYAALATFRQEGIDLIVDTALHGYKVRHKSAALTVLTTLAVFGRFRDSVLPFTPSSLIASLNERIPSEGLKGGARHALHMLVLSLPIDDLLIPVSQSVMHLQLSDANLVEELISGSARSGFGSVRRCWTSMSGCSPRKGVMSQRFKLSSVTIRSCSTR